MSMLMQSSRIGTGFARHGLFGNSNLSTSTAHPLTIQQARLSSAAKHQRIIHALHAGFDNLPVRLQLKPHICADLLVVDFRFIAKHFDRHCQLADASWCV
jgi:hypothetical protein